MIRLKFNQKIIKHFPYFISYHYTNRTPVDYSWKSWKKKTLTEEFLGKSKDIMGVQNKWTVGIWNLWHLQLQQTINTVQFLTRVT